MQLRYVMLVIPTYVHLAHSWSSPYAPFDISPKAAEAVSSSGERTLMEARQKANLLSVWPPKYISTRIDPISEHYGIYVSTRGVLGYSE